MIAAMLMMVGGFLMMLEPMLRRHEPDAFVIGQVLQQAYPPEQVAPPELNELVHRIH